VPRLPRGLGNACGVCRRSTNFGVAECRNGLRPHQDAALEGAITSSYHSARREMNRPADGKVIFLRGAARVVEARRSSIHAGWNRWKWLREPVDPTSPCALRLVSHDLCRAFELPSVFSASTRLQVSPEVLRSSARRRPESLVPTGSAAFATPRDPRSPLRRTPGNAVQVMPKPNSS